MDWNKQIEKLEDELKKLIEKENRLAERKKEVEEKLRKAKEQKENEENKQLAEIVTEYLGPMDAKKIEDWTCTCLNLLKKKNQRKNQ